MPSSTVAAPASAELTRRFDALFEDVAKRSGTPVPRRPGSVWFGCYPFENEKELADFTYWQRRIFTVLATSEAEKLHHVTALERLHRTGEYEPGFPLPPATNRTVRQLLAATGSTELSLSWTEWQADGTQEQLSYEGRFVQVGAAGFIDESLLPR